MSGSCAFVVLAEIAKVWFAFFLYYIDSRSKLSAQRDRSIKREIL